METPHGGLGDPTKSAYFWHVHKERAGKKNMLCFDSNIITTVTVLERLKNSIAILNCRKVGNGRT